MSNFKISKLSNADVHSNPDFFQKIGKLYVDIYSAPPYNEKFKLEEVLDDLKQYLTDDGLFLVTEKDESDPIGFLAVSSGHECDDRLKEDLKKEGIDTSKDIYFSEFGVAKEYRCLGLGKLMLEKMLDHYANTKIFLRTAKYDNDKIIDYYKKFGFCVLNVVEKVLNVRTDGSISHDERVYMSIH